MTSDERLKKLEKWLSDLYREAEKEMRGKWDAFFRGIREEGDKLLKAIDDAKDDDARKRAWRKYTAFVRDNTQTDKYFRGMVNELARQYADADRRAQEIINGQRVGFYVDGYNLSAEDINQIAADSDIGIRFDLIDEDAVEYLFRNEGGIDMPTPRYLEYTKDTVWNARQINAQMAQGIVQGESIPKIAERISNVTDGDLKASVRRARTMATNCHNAGRVQSMKTAEEWGVQTRKQWMCTHDARTRHSHLEIDGETVKPDAVFSNGCRWPGDPIGPAEEVWNCRCTTVTVIDGFSSTLPKGNEDAVHVWIDGKKVK